MKYRTRWTWLLLLAGLMTGLTSVAAAQCAMRAKAGSDPSVAPEAPMPMAMMGQQGACGPMGGMMKDCLGLTEDQQKAIGKLRTDAQAARVSSRKEMMRLRNSLQGELLKDDPDVGAVRKLAQRMGEIRTQLQIQSLEQRLAIRKLLTPEQRDKAIMMRGCCEPGGRGMWRMHPEMGRGGGMGGPGCGGMGGPGAGCMGMGGSGKGCAPGAGCGPMKGPGGGPDVGLVPGSGPDFDFGFGPEFDLGFDLGPDWLDAPDDPEDAPMPDSPAIPGAPGCRPGCSMGGPSRQ
jgi:Spy/CpxP family protein refolding chaperone